MPGPEPKEDRRRRNIPVKIAEAVYLDPAGRKGRVPALRLPPGRKVLALTREQWRAWWRSPQATMWHTATAVWELSRLAVMYDDYYRGLLSVRDQVEMRQLAGQFGLTAKGLRELKWVIGEPPSKAEPESAPQPRDEVAEKRRRIAELAAQ